MTAGTTHRTAAAHLLSHPFLHGLDPTFVEEIARDSVDRNWETGELLVREGAPAEWFYLIFHGKVALEIEGVEKPRLTIQTVGPGEVLGWSWLVAPHYWQLDARAVKPTRTIALHADILRETFDRRPADGYRFVLKLLPVIATRLENTRLQLLDIHGV